MNNTQPIKHGDTICPVYDEAVLPNEQGHCSLCDASFDDALSSVIRQREERAFKDGHSCAVHHFSLYGKSAVAFDTELRERTS